MISHQGKRKHSSSRACYEVLRLRRQGNLILRPLRTTRTAVTAATIAGFLSRREEDTPPMQVIARYPTSASALPVKQMIGVNTSCCAAPIVTRSSRASKFAMRLVPITIVTALFVRPTSCFLFVHTVVLLAGAQQRMFV